MTTWCDTGRGVETCDTDSVEASFDCLNRNDDAWEWDPSLQRSRWVFRGHGDSDWPLVPTAWRTTNRHPAVAAAIDYFDGLVPKTLDVRQLDRTGTLPFPPTFDRDAARAVVVQANAELALIAEFVHRADSLGIHVPGHLPPEFHAGLTFEVNRPIAADDFIDLQFSDQQAALAQHHGVPTRLLDWTDDPLTAAYFSASSKPVGDRIAVWALNERAANHVRVELWPGVGWGIRTIRPPRAPNAFLRAQRGAFTVCYGGGLFALVNGGRFPSLEDYAAGAVVNGAVLRKVTLPAACAEEALSWLERHHITRHELMPSLGSAADAVNARWSGRR